MSTKIIFINYFIGKITLNYPLVYKIDLDSRK